MVREMRYSTITRIILIVTPILRSFMIALHTFNLLFLRKKMTARGQWLTLAIGWIAVLFIIIIGPLAIQTPERGPYFGVSGYWYVELMSDDSPSLSFSSCVVFTGAG